MAENIPAHLIETVNKLVRVSRRLLLDLGREPTPEEIAVEFLAPRAREGRYRWETAGHFCLEEGLASARCCNSGSRSMASICSRLSAIGPGH